MLLQFTSSVQRDIIFLFLAELIWFNLYSIFILQPALVAYLIVYITDMASGSTTATLHYNLTIGLSLLCPSCTLTCSLYYIARVRLPFVLFDLLNGIFLWLRLRFFGLVAHFFLNISALKKTHVIKLGETQLKINQRVDFLISHYIDLLSLGSTYLTGYYLFQMNNKNTRIRL